MKPAQWEYRVRRCDDKDRDKLVAEFEGAGWYLTTERRCVWSTGTVCYFERRVKSGQSETNHVNAVAE